MRNIFSRVLLPLILLALPTYAIAQTAAGLAKELENFYRKTAGATITFSMGYDRISLTFSNNSTKFRIDNSTDLIVSDGTTIWHFAKKKKEVVVDKINSKGSALANAEEIMKFSTNYSAEILSQKDHTYEIRLTPLESIKSILLNLEGITALTLTLSRNATGTLVIIKAMATSVKAELAASNIKIKALKKLSPQLFLFTPPLGTKVIDLRD